MQDFSFDQTYGQKKKKIRKDSVQKSKQFIIYTAYILFMCVWYIFTTCYKFFRYEIKIWDKFFKKIETSQ